MPSSEMQSFVSPETSPESAVKGSGALRIIQEKQGILSCEDAADVMAAADVELDSIDLGGSLMQRLLIGGKVVVLVASALGYSGAMIVSDANLPSFTPRHENVFPFDDAVRQREEQQNIFYLHQNPALG